MKTEKSTEVPLTLEEFVMRAKTWNGKEATLRDSYYEYRGVLTEVIAEYDGTYTLQFEQLRRRPRFTAAVFTATVGRAPMLVVLGQQTVCMMFGSICYVALVPSNNHILFEK